MMHKRIPQHRILVSALLLALAWQTQVAQAQSVEPASPATQAEQIALDIPVGTLANALTQLAVQSDLQVSFGAETVAGKQSSGLKGRFTATAALQRLLQGSGLEWEAIDASTVVVRPNASNEDVPKGQTKPEGATSTAPSEVRDLDAIIVTAQKREERLLDVPMSVSVASAEDLATQGITQFRDYADRIPGLNYTTHGPGYTQISLRGVTVGQDMSPTVGVYIDDVPYGSSTAYAGGAFTALDVGLSGVEQIEVLKGPQGTLYGASTIGGLIKYVTRAPDLNGFGLEGRIGAATVRDGSEGHSIYTRVNMPIIEDKLALSVAGFKTHDGGYIDDTIRGREDVNSSDIYGGRVDLLYRPTENMSFRLNGFLQNISSAGMTKVDYTFGGTPAYGELEQRRLVEEPFSNRFRLGSLTVNYDFGPVSMTSISSYQETTPFIRSDLSALYAPLLELFFGRTYSSVQFRSLYDTEKVTEELRLTSSDSARLEWLLGVFYTREKSNLRGDFVLRDLNDQLVTNDIYDTNSPSIFEELSGFGTATFRATDRIDVSAGVRYAHYDQKFRQVGSGLLGTSQPERRAQGNVFTYLANARIRLADTTSAYFRYATGYRPGGTDFVQINPETGLPAAPENYDSDDLASYEIGLKHEADDRRWTIEASGYYIDWNDIQLIGNRNGLNVRTNAPGGATIKGADLSFSTRPFDGLSLSAALNLQEARLNEADPDLNAARHERLPNSADLSGSLSADYTFSSAMQPWIGATFRHTSRRTSGYDNGVGARLQYELPAYSMFDLRAGVTIGLVTVQAYVRNAFDKRAQLSAYTTYGSPLVTIAQPRVVGFTVSVAY